ncbi:MAG: CpsB/CapC family capsule biosynthesis tyrosine phosphatase [Roseiflexaceae bacterium]
MIDIHSHILYDMDDGALTLAESLAMARMAAADGTRVLVATPHGPGSTACRRYDMALIQARVGEIDAVLVAEQIALELVAGTEICYEADVVERLKRGQLLTYGNTRAILLELSHNSIPPMLENTLFNLQVAGYRVVLAHPERIVEVQQDPNRLLPLIERGVIMQLTAAALLGEQGERLQTAAETLLTHGMAHILASDTHGLPPRRPPLLSAAHKRAASLVGEATATALVTSNPGAVLYGQPLRLAPARPITQQHSWRRRHGG